MPAGAPAMPAGAPAVRAVPAVTCPSRVTLLLLVVTCSSELHIIYDPLHLQELNHSGTSTFACVFMLQANSGSSSPAAHQRLSSAMYAAPDEC